MTAMVSREQARRTCLTAAAGVLVVVVAVAMMVAAAPARGGAGAAHGTAEASAVRLATDVCHQEPRTFRQCPGPRTMRP